VTLAAFGASRVIVWGALRWARQIERGLGEVGSRAVAEALIARPGGKGPDR
jgi:small neutral amino acid transporter SnatA (MarC family)